MAWSSLAIILKVYVLVSVIKVIACASIRDTSNEINDNNTPDCRTLTNAIGENDHFNAILSNYPEFISYLDERGSDKDVKNMKLCIPESEAIEEAIADIIGHIKDETIMEVLKDHVTINSDKFPSACICGRKKGCINLESGFMLDYCISSSLAAGGKPLPVTRDELGCLLPLPGAVTYTVSDEQCVQDKNCIIDGSTVTLDEESDIDCLTILAGNVIVKPGYKGYVNGLGNQSKPYLVDPQYYNKCVITFEGEDFNVTGITNTNCNVSVSSGIVGKLNINGGVTFAKQIDILQTDMININGGESDLGIISDIGKLSLNGGKLKMISMSNVEDITVNGGLFALDQVTFVNSILLNGGELNVTAIKPIETIKINAGKIFLGEGTTVYDVDLGGGSCVGCPEEGIDNIDDDMTVDNDGDEVITNGDEIVTNEDEAVADEDAVNNENEVVDNDNEVVDNDNEVVDNDNEVVDNDNEVVDNDNEVVDNDDENVDNDDENVDNDDENVDNDDENVDNDDENVDNDDENVDSDDEVVANDEDKVSEDSDDIVEDFFTGFESGPEVEGDDKVDTNDITNDDEEGNGVIFLNDLDADIDEDVATGGEGEAEGSGSGSESDEKQKGTKGNNDGDDDNNNDNDGDGDEGNGVIFLNEEMRDDGNESENNGVIFLNPDAGKSDENEDEEESNGVIFIKDID